jgi:hypothetical protein
MDRAIDDKHVYPGTIHLVRGQRWLLIKDAQAGHHLVDLIVVREGNCQGPEYALFAVLFDNWRFRTRSQDIDNTLDDRQDHGLVVGASWSGAVPVAQILLVLVLQYFLSIEHITEWTSLTSNLCLKATQVREVRDV